MQAMLFAAGKGTRLKPLTDILPKALVPIGGYPLLQIIVERLVGAGVDRIVVNVHHHAPQMKNFISLLQNSLKGCTLHISDESAELLETGGGIKKARSLFRASEPLLIHNCDILSNLDLESFYHQCVATDADALLAVSSRETLRYLIFDGDMRLAGWTNIQTGEVRSPYHELLKYNGAIGTDWNKAGYRLYAFSGIHTVSPRLFPLMDEWGDRFPIIDFYLKHCAGVQIRGVVQPNLRLLDVGKLDTLAAAEEFLKTI